MMSISKTPKMLSGINLIGNFIERPLKIGDIVFSDDDQHLIWGNIADLIEGIKDKDFIEKSSKSDLNYCNECGIKVELGTKVQTQLADAEFKLEFTHKQSAFICLNDIQTSSVKLGMINDQLQEYWKSKGFNKGNNIFNYHFIVETIEAKSGIVIFSQESDNTVVLKSKNNMPIEALSHIGNGQVEYVSNSKATLELIYETPFLPLYRAVRYRTNGNFELIGD